MSKVIRVSPEVYARLERLAVGFDTPDSVIRRLLDFYDGKDPSGSAEVDSTQPYPYPSPERRRDTTKYTFDGETYGKGKLVLAVIQAHVANNTNILMSDLEADFPRQLQGSLGVFSSYDDAKDLYERTGHKRHYLGSDEVTHLSDTTVAVTREWGIGNIDRFIENAVSLGYQIDRGV